MDPQANGPSSSTDLRDHIHIDTPRGAETMKDLFRHLAERTAHAVGSHWAFLLALLTIAVWVVTGPYFNYSDTWQLFINTGTTIVTFLMVFLIQNTQNRETRIVALKLDELLRSVEGGKNRAGSARSHV
jgi:low affinity Fe/Cu permease